MTNIVRDVSVVNVLAEAKEQVSWSYTNSSYPAKYNSEYYLGLV